MKYSWQFYWPWCFYSLFLNFLVTDSQGILSEVRSLKLVSNMFSSLRSTTEPPTKSRNIISELNSSNILRGRNVFPINQDISKSVSDEENIKVNGSETPITNAEQISDVVITNQQSTVPGSYSNEEDQANFSSSAFRNTPDLNYKPTVANSTEKMVSSGSYIYNLKLSNHSLYTADLDPTTPISMEKNKTVITSAMNDNNATKELDKSALTNKAFSFNITTQPSSLMKNMKDRETKVKSEINSKPVKKLSVNVKSKVSTPMENSTVKFNKFENTTEQSIDTSSNNSVIENITRNITVSPDSLFRESLNSNESDILASSRQTMSEVEGIKTLNIALMVVAAVAVISIITGIGALSVMLYRRYQWNKPQTFSDKCSNADSTGYIDDSTLKENSEEMYSLDNDSFLNSLEAMTIQNYWVDSIRHTKL